MLHRSCYIRIVSIAYSMHRAVYLPQRNIFSAPISPLVWETQRQLMQLQAKHGIVTEGYSPLLSVWCTLFRKLGHQRANILPPFVTSSLLRSS